MKKYSMAIFAVVAVVVAIIWNFPYCYDLFVKHMGFVDSNSDSQLRYRVLKIFGYALTGIILCIQVFISNRRSSALEKTAEAQTKGNVEERYKNALRYFCKETGGLGRLGSIYQLFYIAKSNHEYAPIVQDLFIERLYELCAKKTKDKHEGEEKKQTVKDKEKQTIIDKLFRDKDSLAVFGHNQIGVNLKNLDLSNLNFSNSYLEKANLEGSIVDNTSFTKANLKEAKLPSDIGKCNNMSGATLSGVKTLTGYNLIGLKLDNAVLENASFSYSNLQGVNLTKTNLKRTTFSGSNLSGVDFKNVTNLKYDQLIDVKTLYRAKNIPRRIREKLKTERPDLFEEGHNT